MMPLELTNPFRKRSPMARIVGAYRWHLGESGKPMDKGEFAAELNLVLAGTGRVITTADIRCWEKDSNLPGDEELEQLIRQAAPQTWQYHFAQDMKAAKYPWIYGPASEIGKRILGRGTPLTVGTE